jgi:hypothetical protein
MHSAAAFAAMLLRAFGNHYRECECAGPGIGIVARHVHRTAAQPCRDIRGVGHVAGGLLERRSGRRCSDRSITISDLGREEQQANPEEPADGHLAHCFTSPKRMTVRLTTPPSQSRIQP